MYERRVQEGGSGCAVVHWKDPLWRRDVQAWLGVDRRYQRAGIGTRLLARALRDCHEAGRTFSFVAVLIEVMNDDAMQFYERWSFRPLPGHSNRLFLSAAEFDALMHA